MLNLTTPELTLVMNAIRKSAEVALRVNASAAFLRIMKKDFSPSTVADYAIQAVTARLLTEAFPNDAFVAEETASDLRAPAAEETLESVTNFVGKLFSEATADDVCAWIDRGGSEPADRFWVLDPLDGTKGYLRGGQYAIALALIEKGQVQLAALGCPNLGPGCQPDLGGAGSIILAARGQGAWWMPLTGEEEPVALHVSDTTDPAQARVLRSHEAAHTNVAQIGSVGEAMGIHAEPVLMDSQAKYAVLAAGGAEVLFRLLSPDQPDYREKIWDQAAGSLVIEEAGGRITDLGGNPLDFNRGRTLEGNRGVLASNGVLHDAALAALAASGAV